MNVQVTVYHRTGDPRWHGVKTFEVKKDLGQFWATCPHFGAGRGAPDAYSAILELVEGNGGTIRATVPDEHTLRGCAFYPDGTEDEHGNVAETCFVCGARRIVRA